MISFTVVNRLLLENVCCKTKFLNMIEVNLNVFPHHTKMTWNIDITSLASNSSPFKLLQHLIKVIEHKIYKRLVLLFTGYRIAHRIYTSLRSALFRSAYNIVRSGCMWCFCPIHQGKFTDNVVPVKLSWVILMKSTEQPNHRKTQQNANHGFMSRKMVYIMYIYTDIHSCRFIGTLLHEFPNADE